MSKETLKAAVAYSNAHMAVERSESLFEAVNTLRGQLDSLSCTPGVDAVEAVDKWSVNLRDLEKLLQEIERASRVKAGEFRAQIEAE